MRLSLATNLSSVYDLLSRLMLGQFTVEWNWHSPLSIWTLPKQPPSNDVTIYVVFVHNLPSLPQHAIGTYKDKLHTQVAKTPHESHFHLWHRICHITFSHASPVIKASTRVCACVFRFVEHRYRALWAFNPFRLSVFECSPNKNSKCTGNPLHVVEGWIEELNRLWSHWTGMLEEVTARCLSQCRCNQLHWTQFAMRFRTLRLMLSSRVCEYAFQYIF